MARAGFLAHSGVQARELDPSQLEKTGETPALAVPGETPASRTVTGTFTVIDEIHLEYGDQVTSVTRSHSLELSNFSVSRSNNTLMLQGSIVGALKLEWPGMTPALLLSFHVPPAKKEPFKSPAPGQFLLDPAIEQGWPLTLTISAHASLIQNALVAAYVGFVSDKSMSEAEIAARMDELIRYTMVDAVSGAIWECFRMVSLKESKVSLQDCLVALAKLYKPARPTLAFFESLLLELATNHQGGAE